MIEQRSDDRELEAAKWFVTKAIAFPEGTAALRMSIADDWAGRDAELTVPGLGKQ
jgi:hypothetical protein